MANVIVNKNSKYKADPLYQWDLNQVLQIYGLSLASIPEIHFTNDAMDKAIVRQSTMDDAGIITVDVPNSLLQKPYKITAYVCVYTTGTFESLYSIEIPVKARTKPADYTLVNDDEVYSFNALENQVVNALKALYSDRAETLSAVEDELNKAVNTLNSENEKFVKSLETSNTDLMNTTKQALQEQYNGLSTEVDTLQANNIIRYEKLTGSATNLMSEGEITYEAIWSRQGNLMNLMLQLNVPAGAWGTYQLSANGLIKPDWFILPDLAESYFAISGGGFSYGDYILIRKNESALGYLIWGMLPAESANSTESRTLVFNTSYIVQSTE